MISWLKKIDKEYYKKSNKLLWLWGAYMTWKYVDKYSVFPAFQYNGFIKLKIYKEKSSKLILHGPIKLEQWLNKKTPSIITLNKEAIYLDGFFAKY